MAEIQECAICGAAYLDANKHQAWHDEIDAWIQLIDLELEVRTRTRDRSDRAD